MQIIQVCFLTTVAGNKYSIIEIFGEKNLQIFGKQITHLDITYGSQEIKREIRNFDLIKTKIQHIKICGPRPAFALATPPAGERVRWRHWLQRGCSWRLPPSRSGSRTSRRSASGARWCRWRSSTARCPWWWTRLASEASQTSTTGPCSSYSGTCGPITSTYLRSSATSLANRHPTAEGDGELCPPHLQCLFPHV